MTFFVARGREKVGPLPLRELQRMAADGSLRPADMVLRQGEAKWRKAESVEGLSFGNPARPAAPAGSHRADRPAPFSPAPERSDPQAPHGEAPARPVASVVLAEAAAVALAPVTLFGRLARYPWLLWRLRSLRRLE